MKLARVPAGIIKAVSAWRSFLQSDSSLVSRSMTWSCLHPDFSLLSPPWILASIFLSSHTKVIWSASSNLKRWGTGDSDSALLFWNPRSAVAPDLL